MNYKISLCIPTYRRFDIFLSVNLPLYLTNPYIDEIVISDEDGEDAQKIILHFPNEPKIKLYMNEKILGAFANKNRVVSLASNEWICLMDSDNYAPPSYFEAWMKYGEINGVSIKTIYMPMCSTPQPNHHGFNYYDQRNIQFDREHILENNVDRISGLLNTGNYIFYKQNYLESNQFLTEYHEIGVKGGLDVIFKSILLFLNNSRLVLVENMTYDHIVHDGSLFINSSHEFQPTYQFVMNLFHEYLGESKR